MNTAEILEKFYTSFSNKDINGMLSCYSDEIIFYDPAFGPLRGSRAKAMWTMLIERGTSLDISFEVLEASTDFGKVKWTANYHYGSKKRKVVNRVLAQMTLKDGKIIKHIDHFNFWKWAQQALGLPGYLLGWSPLMTKIVRKKTNGLLNDFIEKNK